MQIVKLCRVGDAMMVTLPAFIVEALHLHKNDDITIEVVGDHIVLKRVTTDFVDEWEAYRSVEIDYRNANHRLAE